MVTGATQPGQDKSMTDGKPDPVKIESLTNGQTEISIELGPGALGFDGRYKVAHRVDGDATSEEYLEEMAEIFRRVYAVTFGKLEGFVGGARHAIDTLSQGYVGVADVREQAAPPTPVRKAAPVSTPTAQGVRAVANGAPVAHGSSDWVEYQSRFNADELYRTLSLDAYTTEQLQTDAHEYAISQGLDPSKFDAFDERLEGERGRAIGATCNYKVKKEYKDEKNLLGNKFTAFRIHINKQTRRPEFKLDDHWKSMIALDRLGVFALDDGSNQAEAEAPAPQPSAPVNSIAPF